MSVDICDRVYDAYTGEMGQRFMRETQRRVHWMCSTVQGQVVLDVGCSQGIVPILLGREGRTVTGIDTNAIALRAGEQHLLEEPPDVRRQVTFVEGDFACHDFAGAQFDCVVMGEVLEHLLDPERFIARAAELLREGGMLVITVPLGINDHVDHKHTFYLLEPYRLVAKHFNVTTVTILGKWLGIVGTRDQHAPALPLADQLSKLEDAFKSIERDLVDDISQLRAKLDEANTKYRASTEDVARLKRETVHHENERKAAERAKSMLESQLEQAQRNEAPGSPAELRVTAALEREREARHASEVALARLEERLGSAQQLKDLELSVRDAELGRLGRLRSELEAQLEVVQKQLAAQVARAEEREHELASARSEGAQLGEQLARVAQRLEAQHAEHLQERQSSETALRLQAERIAELVDCLGSVRAQARDAASEMAQLTEQLTSRERQLADAQLQLQQAHARIDAQHAALTTQQQRTRDAERAQSELHHDVERLLEAQRTRVRELDKRNEQTKQELQTSRRNERQASAQLERERREHSAAQRREATTRKSLSFQLGYELIHGFKSRQRLLSLPKTLWQLQQEAARRRLAKQAAVPTTKAPTSIAPVGATPTKTQAPARSSPVSTPQPTPSPPRAQAPDLSGSLRKLRVACIHDEFTFSSYAPECTLQQLTPAGWRAELEAFQPQLLFIESAWRGKDQLWDRKVAHRSQELVDIVDWCRSRGIPTAFWNKEDPIHFRTFLNTAKLFDVVFTTDIDCIPRYRRALDHARVYLLPFAFQPSAHNPIEKYQRKPAMCFAGAYYARYPERQADLADLADSLSASPGLEIYDRNFGKNDPDYTFPESYRPYIVGTLKFDEIDRAYKGYHYALNLNSIKASQSMFARRVFELLGSNTITVSNFSRGVRLMFGDLVITTDRGERAKEQLLALAQDATISRRFRLAGLRKVLVEHTYQHRLRFVAEKVWNKALPDPLPEVAVLSLVRDRASAERVLAAFERQRYSRKILLLVAHNGLELSQYAGRTDVVCFNRNELAELTLSEIATQATHFTSFTANDHYGGNFLLDLALATRYSDAVCIGKQTRYVRSQNDLLVLQQPDQQYRPATSLNARAALVRRDAVPSVSLTEWLDTIDSRVIDQLPCLAIDEFNYCENGAGLGPEALSEVDDLAGLDHGLPMAHFLREKKQATGPVSAPQPARQIEAARLASLFKSHPSKPIVLEAQGDHLLVRSSLPDETHEYVYANQAWAPAELGFAETGKFHLDVTPGLNIQLAFLFLDAQKKRVGNKVCQAGANETVRLPPDCAFVQLALRVYGAGNAKIGALLLDHVPEVPDVVLGRANVLLVTNHYPSNDDLYRNGFVHRRVLEYRNNGTRVDVFRMKSGNKLSYHEFEGVDVISGGSEALETLLRSNSYASVLVHFLDQRMWQVLKNLQSPTRLLIWVHGAEIQAWHRRAAHYATPQQLAAAQADTEPKAQFWRNAIAQLPTGSKLVFVSRHFAREVMADLNVSMRDEQFEVIHNVIDTNLFAYAPKSTEQRKRILSIRPYASRIYGNDLTVAAILELQREPFFQDLEFHLVGDGPLFEETTAPLVGMPNVRLERRFVTQREIAELHRGYGVFLCPTRGDTQGVSRDEAMSSGLVPITNSAGAIPEFVDDSCGIVTAPEDHVGLAAGITRLYRDPQLFLGLSARAAARVRAQSGPAQTTKRELALFSNGSGAEL